MPRQPTGRPRGRPASPRRSGDGAVAITVRLSAEEVAMLDARRGSRTRHSAALEILIAGITVGSPATVPSEPPDRA